MNFSRFFVSRPRFAAVLSVIILVAGLVALPLLPLPGYPEGGPPPVAGRVALPLLPIAEYPEVVPPTVTVHTVYPGAEPSVIAETVASPLEQAINGVEGMLYQSSQTASDGTMNLTVTFALGTDGDKAQVLVQNRVAQVLSRLPQEVQRVGVTTTKASPA